MIETFILEPFKIVDFFKHLSANHLFLNAVTLILNTYCGPHLTLTNASESVWKYNYQYSDNRMLVQLMHLCFNRRCLEDNFKCIFSSNVLIASSIMERDISCSISYFFHCSFIAWLQCILCTNLALKMYALPGAITSSLCISLLGSVP